MNPEFDRAKGVLNAADSRPYIADNELTIGSPSLKPIAGILKPQSISWPN